MSSSTSLAGAFLLKRRRANVESRFDRFLKSCRDNLYLVLFAMAKEGSHSAHTKISIAAMLWDALQLLAYPLYYSKKFPWYSMPNMKWLITILSELPVTFALLMLVSLPSLALHSAPLPLFLACRLCQPFQRRGLYRALV